MRQNDFHFLERQTLRVAKMIPLDNGPEQVALEFQDFIRRGGMVTNVDEALVGPEKHIETYFRTWCFLVSLPPRLVDPVWGALMGDTEEKEVEEDA